MGSIKYKITSLINDLFVRVYFGDTLRNDVWCNSVTVGVGTEGSSCDLELPALDWDARQDIVGQLVRIVVKYRYEPEYTLFIGLITNVDRTAESQSVVATARSYMYLASNVYIGQANFNNNALEVFYPKIALYNGAYKKTNWTTISILRDWFGSSLKTWRGGGGSIPSQYRHMLSLGDTSVLSSVYNTVPFGDLEFKQISLKDGLDKLLSDIGTVSFIERFRGYKTYLDFFELASPYSPIRDFYICPSPNSSAIGTNVISLSKSESIEDMVNRIICVGDRRKFVVTLSRASHMTGLWDDSLNNDVLQNPSGTIQAGGTSLDETSQEYWRKRNLVFKKYQIPIAFQNVVIDEQNAITETDLNDTTKESALPIQIFAYKHKYVFASNLKSVLSEVDCPEVYAVPGDVPGYYAVALTEPKMLESVTFDAKKGIILFSQPNVYPAVSFVNGNNLPVEIYKESNFFITFTYNGSRIIYDTKLRSNGVYIDNIQSDGKTEVIDVSFGYIQYGNTNYPLDGQTYSTCIFQLSDGTWYDGSDLIAQDDTAALKYYAEVALQEKGRKKNAYNIVTPNLFIGPRIGDRIRVIGEDTFYGNTNQITSMTYNLSADHGTSITTDSGVPMTASTILKEKIGG
jgi:hypothetical protein